MSETTIKVNKIDSEVGSVKKTKLMNIQRVSTIVMTESTTFSVKTQNLKITLMNLTKNYL